MHGHLDVSGLNLALLAGALVVLVATLAVRLGLRLGVPGLLVFLALGMLIGEAGLGLRFADAALTRDLGLVALVVILAEGGLTSRISTIRPVLAVSTVLATLGVLISAGLVALAGHLLLGMAWRTAVLLGAVVSSTDAAAVFSVLRRLKLRARVRGILEAESGINDAPAVVIVSLVVSASWSTQRWWQVAGLLLFELVCGAAVGYLVGLAGRWLLARIALPAVGLYPLASLALIVAAYGAAGLAHSSGFLAVYVCAVLIGSSRLPHRGAVLGFAEGLAWLSQIGLFVLLGLLAVPGRLPGVVVPALVAGAVLTFVARPLAVALCASWFRVGWREQLFLSAAGLRGAVPIVLATIPLADRVPGATRIFDITFVLVLVFTAVQAPSLPFFARRLRVLTDAAAGELTVDAAPLDEMNALIIDLEVPVGSRLSGEYVADLRLPAGAMVSLVVRAGESLVPDVTTRLRTGDRLLVVTTAAARSAAERRLRAVSRRGVLAGWFGEDGAPD
jgi:potassium/hydrogen antiporter